MQRSDFYFDLPPELIAQEPCADRAASRLMSVDKDTNTVTSRMFRDLPDLLSPDDLLVFNDTKVFPARTFLKRKAGGVFEIIAERIVSPSRMHARIRLGRRLKEGETVTLTDGTLCRYMGRVGDLFILDLVEETQNWLSLMERIGELPLPPYIERKSNAEDLARYQTIYAKEAGSVAAPTAGLHFDDATFKTLDEKGIRRGFVTLHVGSGTYLPVRADTLEEHVMHSETIHVTQDLCDQVMDCKARGGRVIAVGTTSVRTLESAWVDGALKPCQKDTDIFLYPGKSFHCVDAVITNFHLPESTLFMLVCAFSGTALMKSAYAAAIQEKYRFFSYGDAMFLT
ncbi:MAG: tRNA preQ1(34) S-adenosylmethionine ribosyltransferase-isomerase QueA [Pseudobdellovibrionaceae bacterium]